METMQSSQLLEKVKNYAEEILSTLSSNLCYHDLEHTIQVVEAAKEIGSQSNLNEAELELVLIAAWMHDIGYHIEGTDEHEVDSQKMARELLENERFPEDKIKKIEGIILATRMPQNPQNLLEEVLCDADLYHLSSNKFEARGKLLRSEWEKANNTSYNNVEWINKNIEFLLHHTYHTAYGKEVLLPKKLKNLKKLEKKKKKLIKEEDEHLIQALKVDSERLKKMKKKLEKAEGRPERGIETMFRVTSRNHVDFSSMADSKANILISVNSIIITIIIGVLIRKLDNNPHLIIPTFLLLTICLTSIVFAILATRPNVTSGTFTQEDIKNKKANLLFFGNFYKMKLQDFQWGMNEMINDSEYLYSSMIKDIYFIGSVLGKKYQYLRIAYTIFMIGLVISSIAFMIASVMYPEAPSPINGVDSIF